MVPVIWDKFYCPKCEGLLYQEPYNKEVDNKPEWTACFEVSNEAFLWHWKPKGSSTNDVGGKRLAYLR